MKTQAKSYHYSRRIIGAELPKEGRVILISNYRIFDKGERNYVVDLKGIENPFVQVDLPIGGGVSPGLAKTLGVDPGTHVCTGLDPRYWEGLRTLHFYFRDLEKPILDLSREPWAKFSYWGYMFGSKSEGEGRLKIPGTSCFADPYVWSSGDKDFFETALSTQGSDISILGGKDVNVVGRFVYPRLPNNKWLERELERFKLNKEDMSRKQLLVKLNQLSTGLDDYVIRSREILAWPIMSE
jgi:hypothetical protein